MTKENTRRGFTLIELLVVVLIIGILAAVALPQYQKAVTKTRFMEAITHLKTIGQADQACQLKKGESCSFDELEVDVGTPSFRWEDISERSTDNFYYYTSELATADSVNAYAVYKKEDVCLCYMSSTGEILIRQNDQCVDTPASLGYAHLLGLVENSRCACC